MPATIPPAQTPRVRPLWQRHQLFHEPEYTDGTEWNSQTDDDTDDVEESDG